MVHGFWLLINAIDVRETRMRALWRAVGNTEGFECPFQGAEISGKSVNLEVAVFFKCFRCEHRVEIWPKWAR